MGYANTHTAVLNDAAKSFSGLSLPLACCIQLIVLQPNPSNADGHAESSRFVSIPGQQCVL
jgi:hypothetical protein